MAIGTVDITTLESALTASADAIREKSESTELIDFDMEGGTGFAEAIEAIPTGITPTGKLNITDTVEKDVTNYASAQVVDTNLIAANIKEGVTVLGITGTHEGGITPIGTKSITANGIYDVTQFASADVEIPAYDGDYSVSPDFIGRTLFAKNKLMTDNVTIEPIEIQRTSNPQGGRTVYIGGNLNG